MPPTPTPEEIQIETVREIAQLYSFAQSAALINGLNDVQWTATIADITAWNAVKNKHTQIKGDGVDINKDRNRLDITMRVRRRLGIFPAEPVAESAGGSYVSYTPAASASDCGDY